ncbi:EAL domain-containing protein [Pseudoxanthomonas sp. PXM01]|uniref:putative bifunctional diguanylate cyclase/phosphodiesterase n=1 Tax=Pseudoxanthomonas sp. PXM01 TaxID=2769295 RepID=UPI00177E448E|nr:EAL domain-containing protein [Pseudoxanthomonas sp. PXM01]MBD9468192.1 EAL domain-containing protein [Pseudoxanthomonas sp. PXM01]
MIAVVAAAQLATFAVVTLSTQRAVSSRLQQELEVGQRVWEQFQESRSEQLLASASVLADDYGFRAAVASGDIPTLRSALDNHGTRIGADLAWQFSPEGRWQASANDMAQPSSEVVTRLMAQAREDGIALQTVVARDALYLVVMLPVMAPEPVGWLAVGRRYDDALARQFHRLTGLEAAFVTNGAATTQVHASTLPVDERAALSAAATVGDAALREINVGQSHYLSTSHPLAGDGDARVVLLDSYDRAFAPYRTLRSRILMLSGLATLLAVVMAVALGRGISRPVSRLAQAARRIQAGDYTQAAVPGGSREMEELAGAFDRMQSDIAAREERILHQAHHDGLTGLPNRSHAYNRLQAAIQEGGDVAVLVMDINRFKEINDTLGHDFGDQVLREVARRLRSMLDPAHLVARLGGDEFMVLLDGLSGDAALRQAQALWEGLKQPLDLPSTRVSVEGSVGLACHPRHGHDPDTLLRRADIALYDAKAAHGGVAVYEPGRDELHLRQLQLMTDLRQAIRGGQLELKFQPKLDAASARVQHVEALVRWRHPTLGMVAPDEFIPLAERSGFIHELTRFVLDQALSCNAAWRSDGMDLGLAVNLSAMDLLDADLPDYIEQRLALHGVPAARVILEVTESALMQDIEYALRMLHRLKGCGVRLAIDDFGTGYSSLAQLKRMPVDELKIDKSFVMQLEEGSDDAVIVRSTIELGHNMGLSVIAEGVENDHALALLRRYRCDMVQGYLFSAPLGSADLIDWCRRRAPATATATDALSLESDA